MKNLFLVIGADLTGNKWVDSAWSSKDKAHLHAQRKNGQSDGKSQFQVLHTPVND